MLIQAEKEFCCRYKARVSNCPFRGKIKTKTLCCPQQPKGFPGSSEVKNQPASARNSSDWFDLWVGKIPWRRKWQPTPVFLPGESLGQRSLGACSPWGGKDSNRTEHAGKQFKLSMPFIPISPKEDLMYPLAKEARTPTQASLRQIFLVTFSY